MTLLFIRMVMVMMIGCGVTMAGAMVAGHRRMGMTIAYQVEQFPCTTHWIDTGRPTDSFTLVKKPPFCLPHAAWSPNHRYAALAAYPSELLTIAIGRNGHNWNQVIDISGVIGVQHSLAWSPDSTQLAFLNESATVTVIGIVRMVNGVPEQPCFFTITATEPLAYSPLAWSLDGQFIAFAAYDAPRRQGSEELYSLNVSNGAVRRLTTNSYCDDWPSWSPDGTQLVFTSSEDGYNELYVINLATSERRRLTYYTIGYRPNWSPDGKTIVFVSNIDYDYDLYAIGANGFGLRRLTVEHYPTVIDSIWFP